MDQAIKPSVSVIVPVFDEVENIARLHSKLTTALDALDAEIIIVDDGSTDGSAKAIQEFPDFDYVGIPRSGKTIALFRGIERARAPIIVTIDADLQEDPEHISEMVELLKRGHDCVIGCRADRKDGYFQKCLPSRIYNYLILLLFGKYFVDINCGLRACRKSVLVSLPWFEGSYRLIPLLIARQRGRIAVVPVRHRRRLAGYSKFASPHRFYHAFMSLVKLRFGFYDTRSRSWWWVLGPGHSA